MHAIRSVRNSGNDAARNEPGRPLGSLARAEMEAFVYSARFAYQIRCVYFRLRIFNSSGLLFPIQ